MPFLLLLLLNAALITDASSSFRNCTQPAVGKSLIATFDPAYAGGASGTIEIDYSSYKSKKNPLYGKITVNMDVSNLDTDVLEQTYPECGPASKMEFTWHMHVLWNNKLKTSGFLSNCSAAETGGHYDPTFACGPASQYSKHPVCIEKNLEAPYECNVDSYLATGFACEAGDFSGKFGKLRANDLGLIYEEYEDFFTPPVTNYNAPSFQTPLVNWNFILHLACPAARFPRLLCARASLL